MIPIILIIGVCIGFLPRWWPIVGVIFVGFIGLYFFASDDLISGPADAVTVFLLGATSAGVGVVAAWLIKRLLANLAEERNNHPE